MGRQGANAPLPNGTPGAQHVTPHTWNLRQHKHHDGNSLETYFHISAADKKQHWFFGHNTHGGFQKYLHSMRGINNVRIWERDRERERFVCTSNRSSGLCELKKCTGREQRDGFGLSCWKKQRCGSRTWRGNTQKNKLSRKDINQMGWSYAEYDEKVASHIIWWIFTAFRWHFLFLPISSD
jgi:hypothetical protein